MHKVKSEPNIETSTVALTLFYAETSAYYLFSIS